MEFIFGLENYWINQAINQVLKSFQGDVITFDQSSAFELICEEILTPSLFSVKKLIVIKNHTMFENNALAKAFLPLVEAQYDDLNFLFVLESNQLNSNNLLIDYLFNHAKVNEVKDLNEKNVVSVILELVKAKGGTITNRAAIELAIKLPLNLWMIVNEINKLLVNHSKIDETVVDMNVSDYTKDDYFALSNAILASDGEGILRTYQDRLNLGDDPVFIISQIATVFELVVLTHAYINQGLTIKQMAQKTKIHLFRLKKSQELISLVGIDRVTKLLKDLAKLDYEIKSGLIDKVLAMNYFILKLL